MHPKSACVRLRNCAEGALEEAIGIASGMPKYAWEYFSWAISASWHAEIREIACLVEAYLRYFDVVLAGKVKPFP